MKKQQSLSYYVVWLCGIIIIGHSLIYHLGSETVNVISWDVYGYYVYLPAVFNFGDPVYYHFLEDHFAQYSISSNLYQVAEVEDGRMAPIYTIGLAIIWFPAYIIANLIASFSPDYIADGLSAPYQWAVIITNWLFTALGLYFLRKVLLSITRDKIVALVIIFISLGTNYYHYAVFENGMSHSYLFSLYAMLLLYTIQWHKQPSYRSTFIIGVAIALLCLARPSEVVSFLIPLLFGVHSLETLHQKIATVKKHWRMVGLLAITGIALIFIQVLYWKITIGTWYHNGYAEHHFDFLQPHLWEGIFSYRKGWLLYTPMMTLAVLGLMPLFISEKKWRFSILSYFILNIYFVLSWHIWWYASCFGMRALIQSYAVLTVPMAILLDRASQARKIFATVIGIACFFIVLNHFQDWQYRNRILAMDEMTKSFYWNAWGKTKFDGDAYNLIDNDERLHSRISEESQTLVIYQAGIDTTFFSQEKFYNEKQAFVLSPEKEYGPTISYTISPDVIDTMKDKWLTIRGELLNTGNKYDEYRAAKLVFSMDRNGRSLKWRGVRFQRYRPINEWNTIQYHVQLPDDIQAGDQLKAFLWNKSPDTIYTHQLELDIMN